jgi:hypothetical protein
MIPRACNIIAIHCRLFVERPNVQSIDAERKVEPDFTKEIVPGSIRRNKWKAKWLLNAY